MAKKKSTEHKYLAKISDYKNVFGSAQGKRVLEDMCRNHFMFTTTNVKGDHIESIRREGERLVVLRILSHLKLNLSKLEKLIEEEQRNAVEGNSEPF